MAPSSTPANVNDTPESISCADAVATLCAFTHCGIKFAEVSVKNRWQGDLNVIHGSNVGKRALHAQIQQLAARIGRAVLAFALQLQILFRRTRRNPSSAQAPHTADEHEKLMDYR